MSTRRANDDLNKHLGQRLRDTRVARGLSQDALAGRCGITFQQVQKYERGANRIPIDRLATICAVLGTSLEDMVRGLDDTSAEEPAQVQDGDKSALAVLKHFNRIESPRLRHVVQRFIRDLAETQHELPAQNESPAEFTDV